MRKSIVIAILAAGGVAATGGIAKGQEEPAGVRGDGPGELEEIIVTGTRIRAAGFEAPTPVTSLSQDDIQARGLTNIADALNQLPAVAVSSTPATETRDSTTNGTNYINLRGLGRPRTLVLVNGRRYVPTREDGTLNMNSIPQALVQRIETVTGGASASWGSDAVAGVVNVILDSELDGVRLRSQVGMSGEGDGEDAFVSFAFGGAFDDSRGRVVFAGEWGVNEGVDSLSNRDWSGRQTQLIVNPGDTGPDDGIPRLLTADHSALLLSSDGGRVVGGPAPIAFTEFESSSSFRPFDPGMISGIYAVGGEGADLHDLTPLVTPSDRGSVMGLFNYEINDAVSFFMEGSASFASSRYPVVPPFSLITGPSVIRSGNPFIPEDFQQLLTDNDIESFQLFRLNRDIGTTIADNDIHVARVVAGLEGNFFDGWSWDLYAEYGRTDFTTKSIDNVIQVNFDRAADVVSHPETGEPVCRAALDGIDPGCVPMNLFGFGSPSAEVSDYVLGTAFIDLEYTQTVASASITGPVAELPAGPVHVAAGLDYRRETTNGAADELNLNEQFGFLNRGPAIGAFSTKEVFAEVSVPILSDLAMADRLEVTAAARHADYDTIGGTTSWKAGLQYSPVGDFIRFRSTVSRDIRAPSIQELFRDAGFGLPALVDPFNPGAPAGLTVVRRGGNVDLEEERGTTRTAGIVLRPASIEGLDVSVDWYDIEIEGSIGSIGPQAILNRCFDGDQALCAQIVRDASGNLVQVNSTLLNLGFFRTSGVDFEIGYAFDAPELFAPGRFTVRVLGNHTREKVVSADGLLEFDQVGTLDHDIAGFPEWRGSASLGYERDVFSTLLQARYLGSGNFNSNFTVEDIDDNTVGSRLYLDASAQYVFDWDGTSIKLYGGINNLMDRDPPIIGSTFPGDPPTNAAIYDVVGRFFYIGTQVSF